MRTRERKTAPAPKPYGRYIKIERCRIDCGNGLVEQRTERHYQRGVVSIGCYFIFGKEIAMYKKTPDAYFLAMNDMGVETDSGPVSDAIENVRQMHEGAILRHYLVV